MRRIGLLGLVLAAGCSSSGSGPADAATGNQGICVTCRDATDERSDLQRVTGVIDQICASTDGCHGAGAGTLTFSQGMEFTPLIDVPSYEVPTLDRVLPGDPAHSYLYLKLACEGGIAGGCMPLSGSISAQDRQSFHDWIEAGAPTQ